jgi:hypothetical protein
MFDSLKSLNVIACDNYYNCCKCAINATTMLQLMYDVHICDHDTCPHFHRPLWDTFTIDFQL